MELDPKKTVLIYLCSLVLIVTLFFGLRPKGFGFRNQAGLLEDGNGIAFADVGMAFSRGTLGDIGVSDSLSLAFRISSCGTGPRLSKIISLVDANGRALLELEQWRGDLAAVCWDPGGARLGEVGIPGALRPGEARSLVLAVTRGEILLSVDEETGLRMSRPISAPADLFRGCRLLIGLSPTGRYPWSGEMAALAVFPRRVPEREMADFQHGRHGTYGMAAFAGEKPSALFYFAEKGGRTVWDGSGNGWDLEIPAFPKLFRHKVLVINPGNPLMDPSLTADMIMNLLGFIPFGACFSLLFAVFTGSRPRALLLAVCCACALSLGIELAQVFIPTRSSQLLDLALNCLGALIGAAAVFSLLRRKAPRRAS